MAIVICKDCVEQFSSPHPKGTIGMLEEAASTNNTIVYKSTCMGKCPKGKISVRQLVEDTSKKTIVEEYLPEELLHYICRNK